MNKFSLSRPLLVVEWIRSHQRALKILTLTLCLCLFLNACIWGLIRVLVPRAAFRTFVTSSTTMAARGTMTAVAGRAASLSLARGVSVRSASMSRLSRNGVVSIQSLEGATLGRMVVKGQSSSIFSGTARYPLFKMQRNGDAGVIRNFDGQLLGKVKYKNKDRLIEYYDPKGKYLGKDVIDEAENVVVHYNKSDKVIHRSTYKEKKSGEFEFRTIRKFDQDLIEMYAKEIALDNPNVSAAYDDYLDYVEQCFDTRDKLTCAKKRAARSAVVTLMEYYGS